MTFSKWCLQSRWPLNIATSTLSGVRYLREPWKCQNKTKKTLIHQQNPAIRCTCRSCCFIVYQTLKKPQQNEKKGFSGFWRRLVLKVWERAVQMRSSRADLERTEEDLTTHTHTKRYSVWMHERASSPVLLLRRTSQKTGGKKYSKLHSISCNSLSQGAGGKLNQQSTLKG